MDRIKHHIKRHVGVHHINTPEKFLIVITIVALGAFSYVYGTKAYPQVFDTSVSLDRNFEIRPEEPIGVNFSMPVFTSDYDSGIMISPKMRYGLKWERSNARLVIQPYEKWQPGTQYKISFPQGRNIMFSGVSKQEVGFSTIALPRVTGVTPDDNSTGVMVDMEEPITVNFEKPTSDFYLKFLLNSEEDVPIQHNAEKTAFKLLPKADIEYATRYELQVLAKYATDEDKNYKKIHDSSFITAPPPVITWESNHADRLEQAKKMTQAKKTEGKYIDINLTAQVMSLFEDGRVIDSYMISSGKRGMDTPKGETQIYNKFPRAYSSAYGLYMPYWMALTPSGKFGIHELPEWPGGYKEGASHLGTPVSHGCVRLGVGAAGRVYEWAGIGTAVVIY